MFWNYASCLIQSLINTQVIHKCYSAMVANDLQLLSYFFLDSEIVRINSVKNILCVVHFFKCECISFVNSHQFNARPYCIGPLRPIPCSHDIAIDFVRAASLGDVLGVTSELVKTGGASVKLRQTITNTQFCHIVARLVVDIGFVNLQRAGMARACRMPQGVRDKLTGMERGPLV